MSKTKVVSYTPEACKGRSTCRVVHGLSWASLPANLPGSAPATTDQRETTALESYASNSLISQSSFNRDVSDLGKHSYCIGMQRDLSKHLKSRREAALLLSEGPRSELQLKEMWQAGENKQRELPYWRWIRPLPWGATACGYLELKATAINFKAWKDHYSHPAQLPSHAGCRVSWSHSSCPSCLPHACGAAPSVAEVLSSSAPGPFPVCPSPRAAVTAMPDLPGGTAAAQEGQLVQIFSWERFPAVLHDLREAGGVTLRWKHMGWK